MPYAPTLAALAFAALLPALGVTLAGCGGSTPPANDQTTVTVEKPSDSSTPSSPAPPAAAPAAAPASSK